MLRTPPCLRPSPWLTDRLSCSPLYDEPQETLVDLLFDLLRVRQPGWDEAGRLVLSPRVAGEGLGAGSAGGGTGASSEGLRTNLVDQYLSVVLLVLLEVGLVEVSLLG